jgi:hypothetical protein
MPWKRGWGHWRDETVVEDTYCRLLHTPALFNGAQCLHQPLLHLEAPERDKRRF